MNSNFWGLYGISCKVETVGIIDFSSFQCLQIRESFFAAMHAPKSCMNLMLYVVKKRGKGGRNGAKFSGFTRL